MYGLVETNVGIGVMIPDYLYINKLFEDKEEACKEAEEKAYDIKDFFGRAGMNPIIEQELNDEIIIYLDEDKEDAVYLKVIKVGDKNDRG